MDQTNHSLTSIFPLLGKSSKYFGSALPGIVSRDDSFYGVKSYGDSTALKPIPDVICFGNPLKIIGSGIGFVFILVMNNRKPKWIRDKGLSYQSMDRKSSDLAVLSQLDLGIIVGRRAVNSKSGSRVSEFDFTVNVPADTLNATKIADFIQAFVSGNRSPLFAQQILDFVSLWDNPKKLLKSNFDVEFIRSESFTGTTKVCNFVSSVHRSFENFFRKLASKIALTMNGITRKAFDTSITGKFVHPFVAGKSNPSLFFHLLSPIFLSFTKKQNSYRGRQVASQGNIFDSEIKGFLSCP